jgi:putative hydrolase of the HAD superfamily
MKLSDVKKLIHSQIKNIIFDWGGVLVNIDYHLTIQKFAKLGIPEFEKSFSQHQLNHDFILFETGKISADAIRSRFKSLIPDISNRDFDSAWCAMLKDTPPERINLLKELKSRYNLYLLSNTNEIHATYYNNVLLKQYGFEFAQLFKKVYYSHHIGLRKPTQKIYHYVIDDSGVDPKQTLFIDDTPVNAKAAQQSGLVSYHLQHPETILDLFL